MPKPGLPARALDKNGEVVPLVLRVRLCPDAIPADCRCAALLCEKHLKRLPFAPSYPVARRKVWAPRTAPLSKPLQIASPVVADHALALVLTEVGSVGGQLIAAHRRGPLGLGLSQVLALSWTR